MANRNMKILAIDDNQDNLTIIKALVSESFPEAVVFSALNGQTGLQIAFREEPDIILLDIIMPGMDGFEVCRRLKADPTTANIPIIMHTAKENAAALMESRQLGVVDFVPKDSFSSMVLLGTLKELGVIDQPGE